MVPLGKADDSPRGIKAYDRLVPVNAVKKKNEYGKRSEPNEEKFLLDAVGGTGVSARCGQQPAGDPSGRLVWRD